MPDTGAPWNIPYVAGTDLVSDWPTDSQTLAEAIADGLDDAGRGIGTNVVVDNQAANFTTSSLTYTPVTGSVAITLSQATSRVLLILNAEWLRNNTTNVVAEIQFARGGTNIGLEVQSRNIDVNDLSAGCAMVWVDTPGSVGPHTYTVEMKTRGSGSLADLGIRTLIAVEVAP